MHKDQNDEKIEQVINAQKNWQKPEIKTVETVSYTHLTLPTILLV